MIQAQTAKQALEQAAKDKIRVRVFYGDPVTGTDDCDETNRRGKVYKTQAGAFVLTPDIRKTPEHRNWIHTIDTTRVVRIAKYTHGACRAVELYRHPSYSTGGWSVYWRSDLGRWIAIRNGLIHATFGNETDALLYVDYIKGNRARNFYRDKTTSLKELLKRKASP